VTLREEATEQGEKQSDRSCGNAVMDADAASSQSESLHRAATDKDAVSADSHTDSLTRTVEIGSLNSVPIAVEHATVVPVFSASVVGEEGTEGDQAVMGDSLVTRMNASSLLPVTSQSADDDSLVAHGFSFSSVDISQKTLEEKRERKRQKKMRQKIKKREQQQQQQQ
jgi:hypothetical protein